MSLYYNFFLHNLLVWKLKTIIHNQTKKNSLSGIKVYVEPKFKLYYLNSNYFYRKSQKCLPFKTYTLLKLEHFPSLMYYSNFYFKMVQHQKLNWFCSNVLFYFLSKKNYSKLILFYLINNYILIKLSINSNYFTFINYS